MKDAVEIYSKILVATFGFIAPSMTFFLGIFAKGRMSVTKTNKEKIKVFEDLLRKPADENSTGDNVSKEREETNKNYKKAKKDAEKDINLLNPKRQAFRIFISLLLSALFLTSYHILRSEYLKQFDLFRLKIISVFLSVFLLCYALLAISQVFLLMVKLKQDEHDATHLLIDETEQYSVSTDINDDINPVKE